MSARRRVRTEPAPRADPDAALREEAAHRLQKALADEAQMAVRYLHYALSAHSRGENGPARVFAALAVSECIHALRLSVSAEGSTRRSLQIGTALRHERTELEEVYEPSQREGADAPWPEVREAFRLAMEGCRRHLEVLTELDANSPAPRPRAVCGGCGDILLGSQPGPCRICGATASRRIDLSRWTDLMDKL
jgi:rubrerythrin